MADPFDPAARGRRRKSVVLGVVVAVGLAVGFEEFVASPLMPYSTLPQGIGYQAGYDRLGCTAQTIPAPALARRWPHASETLLIVCKTSKVDDAMDFARFPSRSARLRDLTRRPPSREYCDLGAGVVVVDDGLGRSFRRGCAQRHGGLHHGRRAA